MRRKLVQKKQKALDVDQDSFRFLPMFCEHARNPAELFITALFHCDERKLVIKRKIPRTWCESVQGGRDRPHRHPFCLLEHSQDLRKLWVRLLWSLAIAIVRVAIQDRVRERDGLFSLLQTVENLLGVCEQQCKERVHLTLTDIQENILLSQKSHFLASPQLCGQRLQARSVCERNQLDKELLPQ